MIIYYICAKCRKFLTIRKSSETQQDTAFFCTCGTYSSLIDVACLHLLWLCSEVLGPGDKPILKVVGPKPDQPECLLQACMKLHYQ